MQGREEMKRTEIGRRQTVKVPSTNDKMNSSLAQQRNTSSNRIAFNKSSTVGDVRASSGGQNNAKEERKLDSYLNSNTAGDWQALNKNSFKQIEKIH